MATAAAISACAGSHTLEKFINGVARDIDDPETKITVWKRAAARASPSGQPPSAQEAARSAPTCASARWAPARTTRHFSITSASRRSNLGFGGEDGGGIYHSIYDDFYWYTHFADTDFVTAARWRRLPARP